MSRFYYVGSCFVLFAFLFIILFSGIVLASGNILYEEGGVTKSIGSFSFDSLSKTLKISSNEGKISIGSVLEIYSPIPNYDDLVGEYIVDYNEQHIMIYAYRDVDGERIYSENALISSLFLDDPGLSLGGNVKYSLNWTWSPVSDADGYLVFKSDINHGYNFDYYTFVDSNSLYDYSYSIFQEGTPDVSKKSVSGTGAPSILFDGIGLIQADVFKFIDNDFGFANIFAGNLFANQFCDINGSNCLSAPKGDDGYVQFISNNLLSSDFNFFWDNSNKRLGLGTTSPKAMLHVIPSSKGKFLPSAEDVGGSVISLIGNYSDTQNCTHQIKVCVYDVLADGKRVYSDYCTESNLVEFDEQPSGNKYLINWFWSYIGEVDGFRVLSSDSCRGGEYNYYRDFDDSNYDSVMPEILDENGTVRNTYMIVDDDFYLWNLLEDEMSKYSDYVSINAIQADGNVVITGNLTAPNICYSDGTNCKSQSQNLNITSNTLDSLNVKVLNVSEDIIAGGKKGITATLSLSSKKYCKITITDGIITGYKGCK